MIKRITNGVRSCIPLSARMHAAAWLTRQPWASDWLSMGLVRDLLARDPKHFHKFAWSNHLMGYARWYDDEHELFAFDRMQPSRIEFFRDLASVLGELGVKSSDVRSVLEVGCSQGYLLRYLESEMFRDSTELVGLDIDAAGIEKGARYLKRIGSRVALVQGDMEDFETLVGVKRFDVIFAAGVLSYLNQSDAARVVSLMLRRTNKVLALAGLACTDRNNSTLTESATSSSRPGQWIHNFEAMVRAAGGRVVRSRWEGARLYNLQTICFAFALPEESRGMPHGTA